VQDEERRIDDVGGGLLDDDGVSRIRFVW